MILWTTGFPPLPPAVSKILPDFASAQWVQMLGDSIYQLVESDEDHSFAVPVPVPVPVHMLIAESPCSRFEAHHLF